MHTDVYFIAQHDYERRQADEIGLYQGDIIRFIDPLENGWAMGERVSTGERLSNQFRHSISWSEEHEIKNTITRVKSIIVLRSLHPGWFWSLCQNDQEST